MEEKKNQHGVSRDQNAIRSQDSPEFHFSLCLPSANRLPAFHLWCSISDATSAPGVGSWRRIDLVHLPSVPALDLRYLFSPEKWWDLLQESGMHYWSDIYIFSLISVCTSWIDVKTTNWLSFVYTWLLKLQYLWRPHEKPMNTDAHDCRSQIVIRMRVKRSHDLP